MKKYTVVVNRLLFIICSAISLIIAGVIAIINLKEGYELLFSLPLAACICFIILYLSNADYKNNVGILFIFALMFVRYVLHPFILVMGNFTTPIGRNVSLYINSAVWLLIYEMFAITITVILASRQRLLATHRERKKKITLKMLGFILLTLVLFCLVVIILLPDTKNMFRTIFELSEYDFTTVTFKTTMNRAGSLIRIVQTLFSMFFHFLRIMIPASSLYFLFRSGKSERLIYCVALIWGIIQFMFVTSTFAESIVSAVVILLATLKLCPNRRKKMVKTTVFAIFGIFILFFAVRFNVKYGDGNSMPGMSYISYIVNAYFTGVENVAAIFLVPSEFKWSSLFFNLYGAIPFNSTLFGLEGMKLQSYFNTYSDSYGQIVPSIASGFYFFGVLFSPAFSIFQTYWAVRNGKRANETIYYWKYIVYSFLAIIFSLGIAMYSESIVLGWFTSWGLPMYIISCFSDDLLERKTQCNE